MPVSLQSQKRSTWKIKLSLGVDPITKKRRWLTETFHADPAKTVAGQRKEALEREQFLQYEAARGRAMARRTAQQKTMDDLIDEWFPMAQLAENTRRDYASAIRLYIRPRLGPLVVWKLNAWDLDRLYQVLAAEGLHPSRIRKVHNVLSSAFAQAVRWQWITENPALHATLPPAKQPNIVVLDPAEVQRVLDHLRFQDPTFWCFILLAANLGARPGEVCALQWGDFNMDAGVVTIRRAWEPGGVKEPKTGRFRTVALSPKTVAAVNSHRTREAEFLLRAGELLEPEHFLFHRENDVTIPMRRDQAGKQFARIREELGLDDKFQLRNLRHYVATQMLGAGVDVRTVAGRLGHARPATTLDRYAQFLPAKDRDAAEMLDGLLEGRP